MAPVVRHVVPKGCGFLGSWGTVGGPLLLVDLTRLLPLAKGLYRGIVRSRGVCYYGSSGSGGGHGAVIGGFGVFLSSYVGLPYKILRRKYIGEKIRLITTLCASYRPLSMNLIVTR